MEFTIEEMQLFMEEARFAAQGSRGHAIEFECPICCGKAFALCEHDTLLASCTSCHIAKSERVSNRTMQSCQTVSNCV